MQGSGFADRQWLVQRDGRFVQLTEILYRIAEHANGERTPEDIARQVTETTDWMVSADNVRHLIQTKLVPLGLIVTADGSPVAQRADSGRSPLQVNMRTRVLNPRIIEPVARVLQVFFAPPILLSTMLVIVAAHAWLYLVHGVSDSLRAAVYTPGGLVLALALMAVSAIFHEFGHAAGLRYSGGNVRGMGAGLYLVYPTFYTDTTDAYRLGRLAKLRTDLGGIYFHLIFALGIIILYFLSGQEILLAVVVLINGDILYQLIPYVRLDGYWVLTDLTGIPDMLSRVGPFLRSALPIAGAGKPNLPALKPWVRFVFIVYIVLTVPTLALFFLLMVEGAPRFATIGWDAFIYQTQLFAVGRSTGDLLLLLAVTSQMLLLGLSALGLGYVLFTLTSPFVRTLWRWSKPTPTRRVAGALGTMAVIAGVGFVWFPWLPFAAVPSGPAGTESFTVSERSHVRTAVDYAETPPVGGDHFPIWQNCGFYDTPALNETAVHAMEHGAVWITYRPELPREQVEILRQLARGQSHILASPYPDLPSPVVASAWGKQLRLDSADDPRLSEFVRAFRLGRQAPEPGERCDGGVGEPTSPS
jgi:putative peptide zinc metalloprotease protein